VVAVYNAIAEVNILLVAQYDVLVSIFQFFKNAEGFARVYGAFDDGVFNDPTEGDFHLFDQSAAIDKGSAAVTGPLTSDLDGVTRDAAPDLGAYEFE
jgi:hypothetical protein